MRFLASFVIALVLAAISWSLIPQERVAYAQVPVTVIGPVTPGDCTQFFSTTQLSDAGVAGCFGPGNLTVSAPIIESTTGSNVKIGFAPCATPISGQIVYYTAAWGCSFIPLFGDVSTNNLNQVTVQKLNGVPDNCATPTNNQTLSFNSGDGSFHCANPGTGTVTSATVAAGTGIAVSGTCTITTTGTCTVSSNSLVSAGTSTISGTCGFGTTGTCNIVSQTTPTGCTPTDGSGASLTFTGVSCEYTVIGNIVFLNFTVTYPSTANGSANQITGLPVNAAASGYGNTPCAVWNGSGLGGSMTFLIVGGTNHGSFSNNTAGTSYVNSSLSSVQVRVSCHYPIS